MMKAANIARFNQLYISRQFETILSQANSAILSEEDHKAKLHIRALEAMAYRRTGRIFESLEQSQEIWMEDPLQTLAKSNIFCIFWRFLDYTEMDTFLKQKIVSHPSPWNYLFLYWFQTSNYMMNEAFKTLKSLLQVDPYFYEGNIAMASHLLLYPRLEEARHFINICTELRPGDAQTLSLEGRFQHRVGELDAAILLFEKSLELIPSFEHSVMNLFRIYYSEKRDLDRANALISGYRETEPLNPSVAVFYSFAVDKENEKPLIGTEEIEHNLKASINMEPTVYFFTILLMGQYLKTEKFQEVKALIKILMELENQAPCLKNLINGINKSHFS